MLRQLVHCPPRRGWICTCVQRTETTFKTRAGHSLILYHYLSKKHSLPLPSVLRFEILFIRLSYQTLCCTVILCTIAVSSNVRNSVHPTFVSNPLLYGHPLYNCRQFYGSKSLSSDFLIKLKVENL
jgi:hypothetical protein